MLPSLFSILAVIALILCVLALLLVKGRNSWLLSSIKAIFSFLLLAAALVVAMVMLDLYSYKQALKETTIAEVWIKKLDEQYFSLKLKPAGQEAEQWLILGDQWQLDVRLLTWRGPLLFLGKQPLYRLDRLSGRYSDIELERSQKRSLYALHTGSVIDLWKWAQRMPTWVHANYGGSVFMPLADNAHYLVQLSARGLSVKANNPQARAATGEPW